MIIGFTGTQDGMTPHQYVRVWHDLDEIRNTGVNVLHHGDCVGADHEVHRIVRQLRGALWSIVLHPPDKNDKRAYCDHDGTFQPLPYIERNHAIINIAEALIATPRTAEEELRSGTWATIRYAHKIQLPKILVVNPDGSTNTEWSTPL